MTDRAKKTLFLTAAGVALAGVCAPQAALAEKKERCYGIVKEGKNDCAAADSSHSCASYAKKDASGVDWILMPAGMCERIVGAHLDPVLPKKKITTDDF